MAWVAGLGFARILALEEAAAAELAPGEGARAPELLLAWSRNPFLEGGKIETKRVLHTGL